MLILIAGITGMVGQPCAEAAIARGHQVRGIGRDPEKLPAKLRQQLESFVTSSGIYDIAALERAVANVNAVICAYGFQPECLVEGQLLLLRAAERAGVKVFHAASWNYDWTLGYLGQHESYDPYLSFHAQARISSPIKPIYMFTGIIADWMFTNDRDKVWDRDTNTLSYFGDGKKQWICTTMSDIASYTIEAISEPNADKGGYIRVESFRFTPAELTEAYERARSGKVSTHLKNEGSLDDAIAMLTKARETISPLDHEKYIGLSYLEHMLKGTWDYEPVDCKRFPSVKQTTLEEFFKQHPEL